MKNPQATDNDSKIIFEVMEILFKVLIINELNIKYYKLIKLVQKLMIIMNCPSKNFK